jgi:hypothetical protein
VVGRQGLRGVAELPHMIGIDAHHCLVFEHMFTRLLGARPMDDFSSDFLAGFRGEP